MGCVQSIAFTYCAEFPSPSDNDEPKAFVFVYNLPPKTTASELEKKLQKFGELAPGRGRVRIFNKEATNCYAYIEFESKYSARKALQVSHLMIRGQQVSIDEMAPCSNSRH